MTYATDRIQEEIAYIAYHFHWSLETILDLEHRDRRGYTEQIAALVNRGAEKGDTAWGFLIGCGAAGAADPSGDPAAVPPPRPLPDRRALRLRPTVRMPG